MVLLQPVVLLLPLEQFAGVAGADAAATYSMYWSTKQFCHSSFISMVPLSASCSKHTPQTAEPRHRGFNDLSYK
jgi:hypothetical protein